MARSSLRAVLAGLVLIAASAAQAAPPAGFSLVDARPAAERATHTLSESIWSCDFGVYLLGDDLASERPASPRELAVAAGEHGTRYVLVTSVLIPGAGKTPEQMIDNVLASPQGAITGEKFERFEVSFVGAGDTLAAALAALLAAGADLAISSVADLYQALESAAAQLQG